MAEAAYYIAVGVAAGAEVYTAIQTDQFEGERRIQLRLEEQASKNQAIDDETQRLRELRETNSEIIANAVGIDAYGSPSLTAIRQFSFKVGLEDIETIQANRARDRANFAAMIQLSKRTGRAALAGGILGALSQLTTGIVKGQSLFAKTTIPPGTPPTAGINKELGTGILDTPGGTGALA